MTIHHPGDIVGDRYQIERYVNAGGMQEVYRAKDRLLSKNVALKAPKNDSAAKRFHRSAVVSARVHHDSVAKTLDYLEVNGRAYLIEEYIKGMDLGRLLKDRIKFVDPLLGAKIFHHLAKGIAASHHVGVIHRDLKPSNIMVVGGEKFAGLKITDFGIAKMAEEELAEAVEGGESSITASQTAVGALPYMAPEAIESLRDAGKPADVWSLGAMMFELISGAKPFGAGLKAVPKILAAKAPGIPPLITDKEQFRPVGEEVYQLILECLRREPEERPSADAVVIKCEQLCYPISGREFGNITTFRYDAWGFIDADEGEDVFFHVESFFSDQRPKLGDRVWFARHQGGGADRAFPVLRVAGDVS